MVKIYVKQGLNEVSWGYETFKPDEDGAIECGEQAANELVAAGYCSREPQPKGGKK